MSGCVSSLSVRVGNVDGYYWYDEVGYLNGKDMLSYINVTASEYVKSFILQKHIVSYFILSRVLYYKGKVIVVGMCLEVDMYMRKRVRLPYIKKRRIKKILWANRKKKKYQKELIAGRLVDVFKMRETQLRERWVKVGFKGKKNVRVYIRPQTSFEEFYEECKDKYSAHFALHAFLIKIWDKLRV